MWNTRFYLVHAAQRAQHTYKTVQLFSISEIEVICHMGIACHVSLLSQIIKFCTFFFFARDESGAVAFFYIRQWQYSWSSFFVIQIWQWISNGSERIRGREKVGERQFTKISWPLKMLNTRVGTTICADNDDFSCFSCSNYISAHTGKIKWKCKFNDLFRHVRCRRCLCRRSNCQLGKCTRFNLSKCSIFFVPQNSLN